MVTADDLYRWRTTIEDAISEQRVGAARMPKGEERDAFLAATTKLEKTANEIFEAYLDEAAAERRSA